MLEAQHTTHFLHFLTKWLTPARLQHAQGVARVMAELAPIYDLDSPRAITVGLLHDAARDLDSTHQLQLLAEAGISLSDPCERHPVYAHALAGAYLVRRDLGIADELVLDAIVAHSFAGNGRHLNDPLSQCLRFADILAPTQPWLGMNRLRSVVYAGRIEEAALLQCGWLLQYLQAQHVPIHPNIRHEYQALCAQQKVDDAFFHRW
ncbi:MAG: bis(5'-nucleosyl)-tetraphosphatase (symmetrical) YqeK [Anaerolineales bacterium]|nr:bis(5'-nucleosyl)-tetraphosphatase (symmetrical) YqeK [Anaerolineales bacterium]